MYTTIQKWSVGKAVQMPREILEMTGFKEDEQVEILADRDTIIIKKVHHRAHKSIEERLETFYQMPIDEILSDDNLYSSQEYDWGKPMGKEVW